MKFWRHLFQSQNETELVSALQAHAEAAELSEQKLREEWHSFKERQPWQQTLDSTIASEDLIKDLFRQIDSLKRANDLLLQKYTEKAWNQEIRSLRAELAKYQQLYWELKIRPEYDENNTDSE